MRRQASEQDVPEGWGRGRRPVIGVSWKEAVEYTEWLSARTGEKYRLPSEAEWEYASRAGSVTKHSWGNEDWPPIGPIASGCGSRWDDAMTAQVGLFSANAWGLHDMHGNVQEWVQDCWERELPAGHQSTGSAWEERRL